MLKKRFLIAALSALLSLPLTAPASQAAGGLLTAIICPGTNAVVFHSSSKAPKEGAKATLVDSIYTPAFSSGWEATSSTSIGLGIGNPCVGLSDFSSFAQSGVVTSELLAEIESDSGYTSSGYSYTSLGIVVGSTRYSIINAAGDSFSNAPGLYIVDYGAGGSSLGGNDGYSSNGQFLSKVVSTSLPTLKASGKQVTCSAGAYKFEGLNSESAVEVGNYKFSLMAQSGVITTANSTTGSASFDTGSLPKGVMIWCEVEAAVNNRVSIARSIDDRASMDALSVSRKTAIRQARLDRFAKKISDLELALAKVEVEYRLTLEAKGLAIFIS